MRAVLLTSFCTISFGVPPLPGLPSISRLPTPQQRQPLHPAEEEPVNPEGFQVTPSDFPYSHYFSRRQAPIPGRVPINSLIGKPKTLRWRSVNAMLSALADGVERNGGESPCNIVARIDASCRDHCFDAGLQEIADRERAGSERLQQIELCWNKRAMKRLAPTDSVRSKADV
jgi:hypothetical protein